MNAKKPSLSAALHEASGRRPPSPAAKEESALPTMEVTVPSSRLGKKTISGHFDPAVSRQLKQLALDQDSNVQELLTEALNDLFTKHRMNPIA
jgi:hypothetical protein